MVAWRHGFGISAHAAIFSVSTSIKAIDVKRTDLIPIVIRTCTAKRLSSETTSGFVKFVDAYVLLVSLDWQAGEQLKILQKSRMNSGIIRANNHGKAGSELIFVCFVSDTNVIFLPGTLLLTWQIFNP